MPERPLLILPTPGYPVNSRKKRGGGGKIRLPSRERQSQRLEPRFTVLQNTLDARRARLSVEASGITPEEVLVLETAGPVDDFFVAVRKIEGMEWLCEIEQEDIPPDDDFFALDSRGRRKLEKPLRGRVFLVFSNHQALAQMRSLWQKWKREERLSRGLGKWNQLFAHLRNVRPWGVKDRLQETGVLDDWKERVKHGEGVLPCEIELWYRKDANVRSTARKRVTDLVTAQQGHVLNEAVIEEIAYHALLVELPVAAVSDLIEETGNDIALVQCEQIQFFRATGQMAGILPDGERSATNVTEPETALGYPVIALLDGLPLQNHRSLAGRLVIDDPDDIESQYQANDRRHGTAMASLILHGDLDGHDQPLSRKLYVRPILQPDPRDWQRPREESVSAKTLIVDLVHRAVRRIFEGERDEPPSAPTVCVINLSIGIRDRLFDGTLSPLARLLDWLAWRYQVLFIVSAGNHVHQIEFDVAREEFPTLAPAEIQELVLKYVAADARYRRLLSPAEAVNVLTIGALHDDESSVDTIARAVAPYVDKGLPSPINAQGMGYRRAIKPEILAPGGRVVLQESLGPNPNATREIYKGTLPPGQKVAAPGSTIGDVTDAWHTRGTSNATALTSRATAILYDVLEDLRGEPGGDIIDTVPRAVWVKALLTHAAEWGMAGDILRVLRTQDNRRKFKEYLTRLLGYGAIDTDRVRECTEYRGTALSGGNIENDRAYIHRFPLPPSLSSQLVWRRLTITLAWLTPVNPAHQRWRRASLWFDPPKDLLKVDRQQADWQSVKRGTVQHEVLEGNHASVFEDGNDLVIQVNCTADAGILEETVPYALVTTLEVAEDIGVPIYNEVRVRVHASRVRVTPSE